MEFETPFGKLAMKSTSFRRIAFAGLIVTGLNVFGCHADDATVVTEPAPPSQQEIQEQYRIREERMAALEVVHLNVFREEVEAAKTLTVRERLVRAANITGDMEALAEKGNSKEGTSRYAIFPRASHVARVIAARPWIRDDPRIRELDLSFVRATADYRWPTKADQEQLRELLSDEDPDVQAMAIEALATLYDPSYLGEIASAPFTFGEAVDPLIPVPVIEFHTRFSNGGQQGGGSTTPEIWPTEDDPLVDPSFWRQLTLNQYVDRAIRQLTGADVTRATVDEWRKSHGDTEESLWYWEYRLRREFEPIEWDPEKLTVWREQRLAELARLDPLIEAKVLLLNRDSYDQGRHDAGFLGTWQTRLSKDELFQILAGVRLWDDVNWTDKRGYTYELDSQLATRIMLNAEDNFGREDVPQLIELLATTKLSLQGYGRNAWHVGISRLLPAAALESIDDVETRDGYLRNVIRSGTGQTGVVDELVRVGLPNSREFLLEHFFQKRELHSTTHDGVQSSILDALGRAPLTTEHRQFLWAIVTDDRFRPIWMYLRDPNPQHYKGPNDHSSRRDAIWAINKHAGMDFITYAEQKKLGESETSQATFELILARLKAFEAVPLKPADKPH